MLKSSSTTWALVLALSLLLLVVAQAAQAASQSAAIWRIKDDGLSVSDNGERFPTSPIAVLATDRVDISFRAELATTGKPVRAHQAFLLLTHQATGHQVVRVFDSSAQGHYKLALKIKPLAAFFRDRAGDYDAEVILGTFSVAEGYRTPVATLTIPALSNTASVAKKEAMSTLTGKSATTDPVYLQPLPEIEHEFRPPPKQPFILFPLIFVVICLALLAGLGRAWMEGLEVNLDLLHAPTGTGNVALRYGFLGCLMAYGVLYALFWTRWNIIETFTSGIALSLVTVVVGRYALIDNALQRRSLK
ncbi:proteasome regulatory particle base subunit [Tieghemiomyces parasiticus]|uniref:Ribophorin II n=1 Tax=Tieghemiomyces parasiticus TaxID=78921 RepID=A0A9W8AL39_9FUNG|nr:proteasome regulatory particle base subunit [Tieghemiomyces parasiticus]